MNKEKEKGLGVTMDQKCADIKDNKEVENPENKVDNQTNMQEDPVAKKLAASEKTLQEAIEKLAIAEDKYLRLNAEFDNFRKRAARERNDVRINTQFEVLNSVVPVLDHFEFAISSAEQSHNLEKLFEGMKLIKVEFEKALANQGVEVIDAVGREFDPRLHEGIAHEESEEFEKDIVSKQWRLGYKIGERIIRPATVVISSGKKQLEEKK